MDTIVTNWNREPPPGFQGLREDLPLRCYTRHLPHWRQPGATYFVTFRLADSLPKEKLNELESLRAELLLKIRTDSPVSHSGLLNPKTETLHREILQRIERWLDQGYGECWFRNHELASFAAEALRHFDQEHYEIGAFVIMPNHVHCIIRPFSSVPDALSKIMHSRKLWISSNVNRIVGRSGILWQDEFFDRIIRDEEHLYRCIQYIGRNPQSAGLGAADCQLWLQPTWRQIGWDFDP